LKRFGARATIKVDRIGNELMDHSEAVEQMAAERYLLDELTPDAREAFEAHLFDCPDCALDLRAGAAFVEEAKVQLPGLTAAAPAPPVPSREPKSSGVVVVLASAGLCRAGLRHPVAGCRLPEPGYLSGVAASASQPRFFPGLRWRATRGGR